MVGVQVPGPGGDERAAAGGLDPVDLSHDTAVGDDVVEVVDLLGTGAGRRPALEHTAHVGHGLLGVVFTNPRAGRVVEIAGLDLCAPLGDGGREVGHGVVDLTLWPADLPAGVVVPEALGLAIHRAGGQRVRRGAVLTMSVGDVAVGLACEGLTDQAADGVSRSARLDWSPSTTAAGSAGHSQIPAGFLICCR